MQVIIVDNIPFFLIISSIIFIGKWWAEKVICRLLEITALWLSLLICEHKIKWMKVYLLQNIYSKSAVQLLGTFVNFSTKMFDGYKNSKQLKMQIENSFPTVPHSCLYVNVATSRVFVSKSSTKGKLHHLKNSSHYLVTIIYNQITYSSFSSSSTFTLCIPDVAVVVPPLFSSPPHALYPFANYKQITEMC